MARCCVRVVTPVGAASIGRVAHAGTRHGKTVGGGVGADRVAHMGTRHGDSGGWRQGDRAAHNGRTTMRNGQACGGSHGRSGAANVGRSAGKKNVAQQRKTCRTTGSVPLNRRGAWQVRAVRMLVGVTAEAAGSWDWTLRAGLLGSHVSPSCH